MRMSQADFASMLSSTGLAARNPSLAAEVGAVLPSADAMVTEDHGGVDCERALQAEAEAYLRARGCVVFHMPGRAAIGNMPGWPDILAVAPFGKTLWFELKSASGKLSSGQESIIRKFNLLGHRVCVAKCMQDVFRHWHTENEYE